MRSAHNSVMLMPPRFHSRSLCAHLGLHLVCSGFAMLLRYINLPNMCKTWCSSLYYKLYDSFKCVCHISFCPFIISPTRLSLGLTRRLSISHTRSSSMQLIHGSSAKSTCLPRLQEGIPRHMADVISYSAAISACQADP